jgi:hypothetical protein
MHHEKQQVPPNGLFEALIDRFAGDRADADGPPVWYLYRWVPDVARMPLLPSAQSNRCWRRPTLGDLEPS